MAAAQNTCHEMFSGSRPYTLRQQTILDTFLNRTIRPNESSVFNRISPVDVFFEVSRDGNFIKAERLAKPDSVSPIFLGNISSLKRLTIRDVTNSLGQSKTDSLELTFSDSYQGHDRIFSTLNLRSPKRIDYLGNGISAIEYKLSQDRERELLPSYTAVAVKFYMQSGKLTHMDVKLRAIKFLEEYWYRVTLP